MVFSGGPSFRFSVKLVVEPSISVTVIEIILVTIIVASALFRHEFLTYIFRKIYNNKVFVYVFIDRDAVGVVIIIHEIHFLTDRLLVLPLTCLVRTYSCQPRTYIVCTVVLSSINITLKHIRLNFCMASKVHRRIIRKADIN